MLRVICLIKSNKIENKVQVIKQSIYVVLDHRNGLLYHICSVIQKTNKCICQKQNILIV